MEPNTAIAAPVLDPSAMKGPSPRVTFVTDIVTPYMVAQFAARREPHLADARP